MKWLGNEVKGIPPSHCNINYQKGSLVSLPKRLRVFITLEEPQAQGQEKL